MDEEIAVVGPQWEAWMSEREREERENDSTVRGVLARELGMPRPKRHCFEAAWLRNVAAALSESPLDSRPFNKIFGHVWLDDERLVVGAKDNSLALWSLPGGGVAPSFRLLSLPPSVGPLPLEAGGIHDVALSPSGALLASGSSNSNEVVVLDAESWSATAVCAGHSDWVFGCDWISDRVVATASRDRTVKLWSVAPSDGDAEGPKVLRPGATLRHLHRDKVSVWDGQVGEEIHGSYVAERDDVIALACQEQLQLTAVGTRSFVTIRDSRARSDVCALRSQNTHMGIRSLSFCGRLLTAGGGAGRLSFFDLVAGRFARFPSVGADSSEDDVVPYRVVSSGWLDESVLEPELEPLAVYTHGFNPSGARLFVGGGPLLLGTSGCLASVW